jgi:hypothetical protein
MEATHQSSLYNRDHQPIYATKDNCNMVQRDFLAKIEEIKSLIIKMDSKREQAKDQFRDGQMIIKKRLTAIETKLEQYNHRGGNP